MSRRLTHALALAALVGNVPGMTGHLSGQSARLPSTANGDWPAYAGDIRGTRYSPLDQINASNFNTLEVAWRFKTDNLGTRPEYKLEGTPLVVKGVLYATAGTRRAVVALDARTGELMWTHSLREGQRAAIAPRQLSGRGLAYWTDGKGDDRVIYVTTGYRLVALNAKNGVPIAGFGRDGIVDLKSGMIVGTGQQIDLETGEAGLHSTPTVAKDVIVVGSSFKEGMTSRTKNNTKGLVRAFDARTGKLLWTFNTMPRPGEPGGDTWRDDSWTNNGNTGVWTQITIDEDLGLVYLPVESPASDFYGGHRPGDNLYGESLVCVDLKSGRKKWHFQIVHHPIWDYDLSSAAILADITVNGRAIKAVALPTKEAFLYVFDRVTGQPVWPIEERPVPQSDVPGETTARTQPFPTRPPAYARQAVTEDDVIDFTPALRKEAMEQLKFYRLGPMFLPPVLSRIGGPYAAVTIGTTNGGTNWPGAAYDPETHTVFAPASNAAVMPIGLVEPPAGFSDIRYVLGTAGQSFVEREGPGFGTAADAPRRRPAPSPAPGGGGAAPPSATQVQGLPIVKPPYGLLTAIDLDRGDIAWQVPHGDTPDNVRNHPLLQGMNIPKTGQNGPVGAVVTKSLVVIGDPQLTSTPTRSRGSMLRAYDKATGREVGAVQMPAPQSGSPMTYMAGGRQYIVVAVSGGAYSGEYLALALPADR